MDLYESTLPPGSLWAIERTDVRSWLGTRDRLSMGGMEFGARMPLLFSTERYAQATWLKYACDMGYLKRGITLAGSGPVYERGPNYEFKPPVKFVKMDLNEIGFTLGTKEETDLAKQR